MDNNSAEQNSLLLNQMRAAVERVAVPQTLHPDNIEALLMETSQPQSRIRALPRKRIAAMAASFVVFIVGFYSVVRYAPSAKKTEQAAAVAVDNSMPAAEAGGGLYGSDGFVADEAEGLQIEPEVSMDKGSFNGDPIHWEGENIHLTDGRTVVIDAGMVFLYDSSMQLMSKIFLEEETSIIHSVAALPDAVAAVYSSPNPDEFRVGVLKISEDCLSVLSNLNYSGDFQSIEAADGGFLVKLNQDGEEKKIQLVLSDSDVGETYTSD